MKTYSTDITVASLRYETQSLMYNHSSRYNRIRRRALCRRPARAGHHRIRLDIAAGKVSEKLQHDTDLQPRRNIMFRWWHLNAIIRNAQSSSGGKPSRTMASQLKQRGTWPTSASRAMRKNNTKVTCALHKMLSPSPPSTSMQISHITSAFL